MSTEALVLALSAVVRPTSAAAVVAMLATRNPQRLLMAYVLVGLAFSLAVGTLVVVVLQGLGPATRSAAVRPLLDTVLGVSALGYAVAVWIGRLPRRRDEGASRGSVWVQRRLRDLTPSGAAVAGVLTHLPGLVYLAALNAIVGSARGTLDGLVQVAVYNAIWFSLAIVALLVSAYHPTVARERLEQLISWARRHRRVITVTFFGGLGGYLLASGVPDLIRP